jgi:hypothetical protein
MFTTLSAEQTTAILIVLIGCLTGATIVIATTVAGVWWKLVSARLDAELKHTMIERGMSAESIVMVLRGRRHRGDWSGGGLSLPCACEALVEYGGEWVPALVLKADGGRYYVHHIGSDMSENEWVDPDRIHFPKGSPLADHDGDPYSCGTPRKGPVEAEV